MRRRRSGHGDGRRTVALSDDFPDLVPLERIAREVAAEWGVELGEPFALARYSYVAAAGKNAVLKVRSPEDDGSPMKRGRRSGTGPATVPCGWCATIGPGARC